MEIQGLRTAHATADPCQGRTIRQSLGLELYIVYVFLSQLARKKTSGDPITEDEAAVTQQRCSPNPKSSRLQQLAGVLDADFP